MAKMKKFKVSFRGLRDDIGEIAIHNDVGAAWHIHTDKGGLIRAVHLSIVLGNSGTVWDADLKEIIA